jgi:hypothetical protein
MESGITILYENTDHSKLEVNLPWAEWYMSSYEDGDVEIEVITDRDSNHLILNQTELKQVIEFLKSKVKKV